MELLTVQQRLLFEHGGRLSDYRLIRRIGKGKFSVVYKAEHIADARMIALKKIAIFDVMNAVAREKTLKEVRLVQSVQHKSIIEYTDTFIEERELYIAFEWASAGDLKRQIRKANERHIRFDEASIWKYFTQLCSAILYLHREKRIMHRDLKPANIFLTSEGQIKLGDLGLGRQFSENTFEAHSKVGTPLYMSPEVLRGEPYDWSSDIWSLGCILYELIMLRNPFKSDGLNLHGLFIKINKGEYEPLPLMYSKRLRGLVTQMLALNAASRLSIDRVWECCQRATSTFGINVHRNYRKETITTAIESQALKATNETGEYRFSTISEGNAQLSDEETHNRQYKTAVLMEAVLDKLGLLRYKPQCVDSISPDFFMIELKHEDRRSDERFEEMCACSLWLLKKIGLVLYCEVEELMRQPRIRALQTLIALAERVNPSLRQIMVQTLVPGSGYFVCVFLNSLCDEAVRIHAFYRPIYNHNHLRDSHPDEDLTTSSTSTDCDEATLSLPSINVDCTYLARTHDRAGKKKDELEGRGYILPTVSKAVWIEEVERVRRRLETLRFQLAPNHHIHDCPWRVHLVALRRYEGLEEYLRPPTRQRLTLLSQAWIVVILSNHMME